MSEGPWYWCLADGRVEPHDGCPADRRLGPYATREEAADALARAQQRNDAWENDPCFTDPDDDDDGGSAFDAFRA